MTDAHPIREMQSPDIPDCLRLLSECFGAYADRARSDLTAAFDYARGFPPIYYVAETEGRIVGLVGYIEAWRGSPVYDLTWLCVREDHRGLGIGRRLVLRCFADIGASGTFMTTSDVPGFYARMGFTDRGPVNGDRLLVWGGGQASIHPPAGQGKRS